MMSVSPAVARQRFARFIARALKDARSRGMTDAAIHRATGIPGGTFHRWQSGDGGLPKWEKVAAFCRGLGIPTDVAAAVLGITGDRPTAPEPLDDPDLVQLGRILRDPNVPDETKSAIRHTIRALIASVPAGRRGS